MLWGYYLTLVLQQLWGYYLTLVLQQLWGSHLTLVLRQLWWYYLTLVCSFPRSTTHPSKHLKEAWGWFECTLLVFSVEGCEEWLLSSLHAYIWWGYVWQHCCLFIFLLLLFLLFIFLFCCCHFVVCFYFTVCFILSNLFLWLIFILVIVYFCCYFCFNLCRYQYCCSRFPFYSR